MGQYSDMADRVANFRDNLEDEHERATREATDEMRDAVYATIRANDSVARRVLVNDVRTTTDPDTAKVVEASVSVPEWAKYLEHGTGQKGDADFPAPDTPPYGAILEWAYAKPIRPREANTIEDAAFRIANSIADEGTLPHPFLRPVWHSPQGRQSVVDENVRAIRRAWRRA